MVLLQSSFGEIYQASLSTYQQIVQSPEFKAKGIRFYRTNRPLPNAPSSSPPSSRNTPIKSNPNSNNNNSNQPTTSDNTNSTPTKSPSNTNNTTTTAAVTTIDEFQSITDPNPAAREAAAELLGNLGFDDESVIQALLLCLNDSVPTVRLNAIKSLCKLNASKPEVISKYF